ncbi:MAG: TrwC relaxase, partial [Jiangellaceae bacterium]
MAWLRQAEAYHQDLEQLLPRLVTAHQLDGADDIAAVLRHRIEFATGGTPFGRRPRLIAGLVPEVLGPIDPEYRRALDERQQLIENRALALAQEAVSQRAPWTTRLGETPPDPV